MELYNISVVGLVIESTCSKEEKCFFSKIIKIILNNFNDNKKLVQFWKG